MSTVIVITDNQLREISTHSVKKVMISSSVQINAASWTTTIEIVTQHSNEPEQVLTQTLFHNTPTLPIIFTQEEE